MVSRQAVASVAAKGRLVPSCSALTVEAFMRTTDYEGSAIVLARVLGDAPTRARMGEVSRREAERLFDLDAHVARLEAIYLTAAALRR